ncbi:MULTISPECIES: DMT family transporter [unclassified Paenibacillus]|uniref:DMT family transporter n=1 Tax=unclassified Paenibacillus TaxID=185978 RepID=UPI00363A2772
MELKNNKQTQYAYLAAGLYSLCIGFSFIFVKLALLAAHPIDILAHRFTVSFAAASIPVLMGWVRINIKPKAILPILPLALLYPVLFFTFQTFGLFYISSSEAGIIQATVPIFTMIAAAYFLKEHSSRSQKLFVLLAVAGVIYMVLMKGVRFESANMPGTILMLLTSLSLAGYTVLTRKKAKLGNVLEITYLMTAFGFVIFNSLSVIRHLSAGTLNLYFEPFTSPSFVVSILYLGICSSLASSLLSNYALSQIEATKISVFNHIATLITIAGGYLFLQESLEYYHLIGAIMIIAGVAGTNSRFSRAKPTPKNIPAA